MYKCYSNEQLVCIFTTNYLPIDYVVGIPISVGKISVNMAMILKKKNCSYFYAAGTFV